MKLDKTIKELLEKQHDEDMELLHGIDDGDFEKPDIGRYVLRRMNAIRKLFGKDPISVEDMRQKRRQDREIFVGREDPASSRIQLNKYAERQEDTMASEKIEKIYKSLNDSEKLGLCFGLFPHRLKDKLDKGETVELMDLAIERQPVDFGGGQ